MLALLSGYLAEFEFFSAFRLFDFLTVRASLALLFAFGFCLVFGNWFIRRLEKLQAIQYIHDAQGDDAISLQSIHGDKKGTPTMGGLLMLPAMLGAILLFGDLQQPMLWMGMLGMISCGGIGFYDDYLKTVKKNSDGLHGKGKIILQAFIGIVFGAVYLYVFPDLISYSPGANGESIVGPGYILPLFFKQAIWGVGVLYLLWVGFMFVATTNSVNLTDGQDGLAAGVTVFVSACLAIVCYLAGRVDMSSYLIIPHVIGGGELTVILSALTGACLGFLWYNSHPAQVFMGDTGSMMIGGVLAAVAVLAKQEFLLALVGGIFVLEALSVIVQISVYKMRKSRVLLMSPIHHHFQLSGIPESKITMRFWIVSALLAITGLATLKLR